MNDIQGNKSAFISLCYKPNQRNFPPAGNYAVFLRSYLYKTWKSRVGTKSAWNESAI